MGKVFYLPDETTFRVSPRKRPWEDWSAQDHIVSKHDEPTVWGGNPDWRNASDGQLEKAPLQASFRVGWWILPFAFLGLLFWLYVGSVALSLITS